MVEVFVSGSRAHWLKPEGAEAGVYIRLGSTNRQADAMLIDELLRSAEGVALYEMPMPEQLWQDDFDLDAARRLFDEVGPLDSQALCTLKLLAKYLERWVPIKGAVLLSGMQRTQHFPDAWMQCSRSLGGDVAQGCRRAF